MIAFLAGLPRGIEEAAPVDGASRWLTFLVIALPLTLPGLAVTAVLVIFFSWNEFLFALVLTGPATQTMPIGVSSFIGTVSVNWGGISAAAVLAMFPLFAIALARHRFLVSRL